MTRAEFSELGARLRAVAPTIPQPPDVMAIVRSRVRRRRITRWAGTGVALASLVVGAVGIPSLLDGSRTPRREIVGIDRPTPASSIAASRARQGAPEWYAAIQDDMLMWFHSDPGQVPFVVRQDGVSPLAVASMHDGRSVLYASAPTGFHQCTSHVAEWTVVSARNYVQHEVPGLGNERASVNLMSVSLDGRLVALAERTASVPGGRCDRVQLSVVDLSSGARRTWPLPKDDIPGTYFISQLSWSPDNRHVALHYGQCCADAGDIWTLDTHSDPGPLVDAVRRVPLRHTCWGAAFVWTQRGLVAVEAECDGSAARLVLVDPRTAATTPVGPLPEMVDWLAADRSGQHLLAYTGGDHARLFRVDRGVLSELRDPPAWNQHSPPTPVW